MENSSVYFAGSMPALFSVCTLELLGICVCGKVENKCH